MRVSKLGSLAIFALIASCSGPSDGSADTADVAAGTRAQTPSAAADVSAVGARAADDAAADDAAPGASDDATLVGFAGSRFIVFDTTERTIVLDVETEQAFGVYGHALTRDEDAFDPWTQAGLAPSNVGSRVVASDDGATMLVQTSAGIHAVDLGHRGALLTGWRGEAEAVDIAPDGSMFVARTNGEIHLVRITDGARSRYAYRADDGQAPVVEWTADSAFWSDADGARIVDRETFDVLRIKMASASVVASKDGKTFVASRQGSGREPGVVEVWRIGEAKPRSKIVSAFVYQLTIDEDGRRVAWSETSGEYDAPMFLHTLDVGSGVHARFSAHGHCALGVEQIVGFEDGALITDAECSPGCPSLPSQAQLIAYDFSTGKKLRERSGELVPPYNDELARRVAIADDLSARLGVASDAHGVFPLIHSPKDDSVVVATGGGLRLVADTSGAVLAELPSSSGFSVESVRFAPDGRRVLGTRDDGTLAVWDASTGKRIWASK